MDGETLNQQQVQYIESSKQHVLDISFLLSELELQSSDLVKQIIKDYGQPIIKYRDDHGFTLLHHVVLKSIDGKVQFLIDYAIKEDNATPDDIKEWVNAATY